MPDQRAGCLPDRVHLYDADNVCIFCGVEVAPDDAREHNTVLTGARFGPEDVRVLLADLHGLARMGPSWSDTLIRRLENEMKRWADV